MPITPDPDLRSAVRRLKEQRNALILAHNYQNNEVQDIADQVGDSLALSRLAAGAPQEVIVFCGVHFMAESAAVLAPEKTILLPAPDAGCPLAEMADPAAVRTWREKYPRAAVVAYINSSAAVKAESDICCTSANAVEIVRSLENEEIVFLPDRNLGSYVASQLPAKTIHLWPGCCHAHHGVEVQEVNRSKALYPGAEVLAHPECRPEVAALADFVGSTAQIIKRAGESQASSFIIGTEMGVIHGLQERYPSKQFHLLSPGLVCPEMKKITLRAIAAALRTMQPAVSVPEPVRSRAGRVLERMMNR